MAKGQPPPTGPLPTTCAAASQLTAANLAVDTSTSQATKTPSGDPQFTTYPTTSPDNDKEHSTVSPAGHRAAAVNGRYVLGPAALSGTGVHSATAQVQQPVGGQHELTSAGSQAWDTLAQQQFHAIITIDLDGQVIAAPITQPSQGSFTPFNGQVQIRGSFTENQAKTLATD